VQTKGVHLVSTLSKMRHHVLRTYVVLILGLLGSAEVAGKATHHHTERGDALASPPPVKLIWTEEFPSDDTNDEKLPSPERKPPRRKILSTEAQEQPLSPYSLLSPTSQRSSSAADQQRQSPHKLRTNRWELRVHWRNGRTRSERLDVEFSDNGYVRLLTSDSATENSSIPGEAVTASIGNWELAPHGLTWKLPMGDRQLFTFYGDLLLNPFGDQPKITRGLILRETKSGWFRPVVATFTASGIGEDTADLSYRNRKRL
jgi:hypothetical protein